MKRSTPSPRRESDRPALSLLEKAERSLSSGKGPDDKQAREFLRLTSDPRFLRELGRPDLLERWAEASFLMIQRTGYGLRDMFEDRIREDPDRVLFQDMSVSPPRLWSYEAANRHILETAAALFALSDREGVEPRLAIYAENHAEGAFADLACLFYDILDTPLNPHFSLDNIVGVFDALSISLVLANDRERIALLKEARRRTAKPFLILVTDAALRGDDDGIVFLPELCKQLGAKDIDARLARRRRFRLDEVATVMFTSGSTGRPKGVSFSIYNLVSKRFARAAALPAVGPDEVFLSFLPLFHTFGRFLEMLGTIFWRGTYVFAGNPSAETLFSLLPKVRPTGFISVPVRWAQLHEKCLERIDAAPAGTDPTAVVREVVGPRLKWGLSAAGYLDPRVFRFFTAHGVDLMSGFGMTEGTGGITMTPPGGYVDGSHGLPLPGLKARLGPQGELQVSGHYVARYLEDKGPGDTIPYPSGDPERDYWLATGDVFERQPNGYYQIVDRIKDIYKNNRGQTIAPRKVEEKFVGVPGIKRTFLVGDGRPYNVLFIVPDYGDPVLAAGLGQENAREYYRRIVTAANDGLAPYERVINFAVLERDFSLERGELTTKSSFNRKRIATSFAAEIEDLYRRRTVDLPGPGILIRIPLWFFRDLGILDDEIVRDRGGLRDLNRGLRLPLRRGANERTWLVGDLEYEIAGGVLDLGVFARQPVLWAGNPTLAAFSPVKEGWDLPLDPATGWVSLPRRRARTYAAAEIVAPPKLGDPGLVRLHGLLAELLFSAAPPSASLRSEVERIFYESPLRTEELVRARLRALARHPREELRCWAYRILLLFDPDIDYGQGAADFVRSGLPFLNRESIDEIVSTSLGRGRLDAFRVRLRAYRETLPWPADQAGRQQFERIFRLLADLAIREPGYFSSIRAELASWVLHRSDPKLAQEAERELDRMSRCYGKPAPGRRTSPPRPVCDDSVTPAEARRIRAVLDLPAFLRDSVTARLRRGGLRNRGHRSGRHLGIAHLQRPTPHDLPGQRQHLERAALRPQARPARGPPQRGGTRDAPLVRRLVRPAGRAAGPAAARGHRRENGGRHVAPPRRPDGLGEDPRVLGTARGRGASPRPLGLEKALRRSDVGPLPGLADERPPHPARPRLSGQRGRPRARIPRRHLPRLDRRLAALVGPPGHRPADDRRLLPPDGGQLPVVEGPPRPRLGLRRRLRGHGTGQGLGLFRRPPGRPRQDKDPHLARRRPGREASPLPGRVRQHIRHSAAGRVGCRGLPGMAASQPHGAAARPGTQGPRCLPPLHPRPVP